MYGSLSLRAKTIGVKNNSGVKTYWGSIKSRARDILGKTNHMQVGARGQGARIGGQTKS